MTMPLQHPDGNAVLKPGDRYLVRNTVLSGKPIIEGTATLVRQARRFAHDSEGELWRVRFDGDPGLYERWILPGDRIL